MKILIAGDWHSELHEEAVYQAFQQLGHEPVRFSWHQYFKQQGMLGRLAVPLLKAQNKYMLGPVVDRLNLDLVALAANERPDIVFIYRGSHVYPGTLREFRRVARNAILVGYNNDDPFSPRYPRWKWRHFLAGVPEYDLMLAYRPLNIEEFKVAGAKRVELLRSWFIPERNYPVVLSDDERARFDCDVVFVGHYEDDGRLSALAGLAEAGFSVKIFGPYKGLGPNGWHGKIDRYSSLRGCVPTEFLNGAEYVKALCGARIALCFLSKLNRDSYTRRCFEIPAVGAALFSEYSDDLGSLFSEGIDAELFRNHAELIAKVRTYLNDVPRLAALRAAGMRRVWSDGHDVGSRAKQLIKWIEDIA